MAEAEPRLSELSWGAWDGRLRSELRDEHPERFQPSEWPYLGPGGETVEAAQARLIAWLADLPPEPERRVIAVSHGVTGQLLRGVYGGLTLEESSRLATPQDAVFRLLGGVISRFDHETADEEPL